jgi:hypothetical protein
VAWNRSRFARGDLEVPTTPIRVHTVTGEFMALSDEGAIAWQRGHVQTFLDTIDAIPYKGDSIDRPTQERVIAAMQAYLPGDATLFLLDHELDLSIPANWRKRATVVR